MALGSFYDFKKSVFFLVFKPGYPWLVLGTAKVAREPVEKQKNSLKNYAP